MLRGFAAWSAVLQALTGLDGTMRLVQQVQSALLCEKWSDKKSGALVEREDRVRRNALRQVRIPRTSDFEDYMDRRRHSWLRPPKPSNRFLDEVILALPAVSEFGSMLDKPDSGGDETDSEDDGMANDAEKKKKEVK